MNINIRSEKLQDYNSIAEVSLLAFREDGMHYIPELILIDTLRHRYSFDQELSLVAEIDNKIVGYALFSPCEVYLKNSLVKSVFLAPIAVHPDYQKIGIGGKLIEEGHCRAKNKGYSQSILYGHENYYPRFGYKTNMFSGGGIIINKTDLPSTSSKIIERPVMPDDIDEIVSIWELWHKGEEIAMFPGRTLIDWISHTPKYISSSIIINDKLAGYIRYDINKPSCLVSFIANSKKNAMQILGYIREKIDNTEVNRIHVPANPVSKITKEFILCPYDSNAHMSVHAMLKILDDANINVCNYFRLVQDKKDFIGVMNLPAQFEIA